MATRPRRHVIGQDPKDHLYVPRYALRELWRQPPFAVKIYLFLCAYDAGEASHTVATLAGYVGMNLSRAERGLESLIAGKLIEAHPATTPEKVRYVVVGHARPVAWVVDPPAPIEREGPAS